MAENKDIGIQILHHLPGRLRLSLTHAPLEMESMRKAVSLHPGFLSIDFTCITGSLLVRYDTEEIEMSEVILRIAVYLCEEHKKDRAALSFASEHDDIGLGGYLSGGLLLTAALIYLSPAGAALKNSFKQAAVLSTTGAVIAHGLKEIKDHGMFDPEVLSLSYLIVSIIKGGGLRPAAITWGTTYGRHLFMPEPELLSVAIAEEEGDQAIEVKVKRETNHFLLLFRLLPVMTFDILTGGRVGRDTLLDEMKQVSRSHEDLLEGLSRLESGFNLSIG